MLNGYRDSNRPGLALVDASGTSPGTIRYGVRTTHSLYGIELNAEEDGHEPHVGHLTPSEARKLAILLLEKADDYEEEESIRKEYETR